MAKKRKEPSVWVVEQQGRVLFMIRDRDRARDVVNYFSLAERLEDDITGPHEYRRVPTKREKGKR